MTKEGKHRVTGVRGEKLEATRECRYMQPVGRGLEGRGGAGEGICDAGRRELNMALTLKNYLCRGNTFRHTCY